MYFYRISHGCNDGHSETILFHQIEFTDDQISEMIGKAIIAIVSRSSHPRGTYGFPRKFEDIHEEVIQWLVTERGFEKLSYSVEWGVHSFASLYDLQDHRYGEPSSLDPITEQLNEMGYSRKDDWMLAQEDTHELIYNEMRQVLSDSFYESGVSAPADYYAEEKMKTNMEAVIDVVLRMFDDQDTVLNIHMYTNLLRMVSRLEITDSLYRGFISKYVAKTLSHQNVEVRDAAIRVFENWGDKRSLQYLKDMPIPSETWLAEYREKVISDLEEGN